VPVEQFLGLVFVDIHEVAALWQQGEYLRAGGAEGQGESLRDRSWNRRRRKTNVNTKPLLPGESPRGGIQIRSLFARYYHEFGLW
jgi:hypothetical protein